MTREMHAELRACPLCGRRDPSTPTADEVRRAVLRDGIKGRDEEIARYQGRAERAEADAATLRELVQQAVTVFESAEFKSAFTFAYFHGAKYRGPKFDVEKARAALTSGGQP